MALTTKEYRDLAHQLSPAKAGASTPAEPSIKHSHGQLLSACLQVLELRGIFAWKNNSGALQTKYGGFVRFGKKGSPDIIAILPGGKFLGVECKVGYDKQRVEQSEFEAAIVKQGGYYLLVRNSVDRLIVQLDQIEEFGK
jgi:hypothetical protein